jgi:cell division protein FtsB
MLLVFLVLHSTLRGTVNEKAEEEKILRVKKTKLEEEFKRLNRELNVVGTEEYIMSSAVKDYSYVKKDAIRFEFTNPEVLYAYSEAELQILMDEMND